ncbi:MAG: hypothetical protein BroJett011_14420 [Chloroflexota bacterium]|nr:MAG: hypothetical protein BroJett011_14420 [Chloroflexota bacterium]
MSEEVTPRELEIEWLQKFRDSIAEAGTAIAELLTPLVQQLVPAMQAVYDAFWWAYREAGAPYGETDDRLLRWAREMGEARRLQTEAERILQHYQMLADFRQALRRNTESEGL